MVLYEASTWVIMIEIGRILHYCIFSMCSVDELTTSYLSSVILPWQNSYLRAKPP